MTEIINIIHSFSNVYYTKNILFEKTNQISLLFSTHDECIFPITLKKKVESNQKNFKIT